MEKKINPNQSLPKQVLIFNAKKLLVAKVYSLGTAAIFTGVLKSSVSNCCSGVYIAAGGYYFRYSNPNIEIEDSDYGMLDIREYDKICGLKRRYYRSTDMSRVGTKYNMKPSQKAKAKEQCT